jgi:hypothetical protein
MSIFPQEAGILLLQNQATLEIIINSLEKEYQTKNTCNVSTNLVVLVVLVLIVFLFFFGNNSTNFCQSIYINLTIDIGWSFILNIITLIETKMNNFFHRGLIFQVSRYTWIFSHSRFMFFETQFLIKFNCYKG